MYKLHTWTHGDTLIVKFSQKFPSVFGRYLEFMNITLRRKGQMLHLLFKRGREIMATTCRYKIPPGLKE
jgi:hypothetical protein